MSSCIVDDFQPPGLVDSVRAALASTDLQIAFDSYRGGVHRIVTAPGGLQGEVDAIPIVPQGAAAAASLVCEFIRALALKLQTGSFA